MPPNLRTEEDFDAGGKYHIASGGGYIHYFTAYIYQFQFYKSLCIASGEYDPTNPIKSLHNCNFYGKLYFIQCLKYLKVNFWLLTVDFLFLNCFKS